MRSSFGLDVMKDLRNKKKRKVGGGTRSILKTDLRLAAICKEIPKDILMEILVRLPVVSLMRFKCVSKFWSSLISSRDFTNLFFKFLSSMKLERLFVYTNDSMLFQSSLSNLGATDFLQLNLDLTFPCIKKDRLKFVNALRGLMCFSSGREIRIINFTTRQVLNLPLVDSNMLSDDYDVWNYFGYHPVNDEYKVLSTISAVNKAKELRSETQVLVLGEGASWRNTKSLTSPPPHHHPHEGIFINGVLYYSAWSREGRCVLMSFDFNSEEFNLIEFPSEASIKWRVSLWLVNLTNYQGQVALLDCSRLDTECILDLWVVEDARKIKWSHKFFVLPCHQIKPSLDVDYLRIRGTSRSGEVTLCGRYETRSKKIGQVIYDLEKNSITREVSIDLPYTEFGSWKTNLWFDAESIMYLEV